MKTVRRRVLAALFPLCCAFAPAVAAEPGATLRVMAYNIHHGEGEDGKLDLPRIARVIREAKADIVLLQEVDDRATRTNGVAQAEELAKLTEMKATFGKAMDFQGGGYGNAVLTRQSPEAVRTVPLPGGGEPRCALEVTLAADGARPRLTVVSTHLDVSSAEARATHAKLLATDLAKRPELVLLGGDFNATPEAPPLAAFGSPWLKPTKQGANTATIPSAEPVREIDFILIKPAADGPAPVVTDYRVIEEKVASDHRPIVMGLEFAAGK